MSLDRALDLGREAILLALNLGAPVLLIAAAVGLIVGVLQAVTQVQDQTLSFVPKIAAVALTLLYLLPWLMSQTAEYATELIRSIPAGL